MNKDTIKEAIAALFQEGGELRKFREHYSSAVVQEVAEEISESFANKIMQLADKNFSERAAERVRIKLEVPLPEQVSASLVAAVDATAVGTGSERTVDPVITTAPTLHEENAETSASTSTSTSTSTLAETAPPLPVSGTAPAAAAVEPIAQPRPAPSANPTPTVSPLPSSKSNPMPSRFNFRLKGGKLQVGVLYEGIIEAAGGAADATAKVISVRFPEGTGLAFDPHDPARITGTPAVSGDFTIAFDYSIEAPGLSSKMLSSSLAVFVNHDPKSLWKDLPSDQSDPHWKSDTDSHFLAQSGRKIVAASKRGRSHAHEGKFRDDDFKVAYCEASGWYVLAVADGAGSASKSRLGSRIAVTSAVEGLLEKLAGEEGRKLEKLVADWKGLGLAEQNVISTGLYPVLGTAAFEACKLIEAEAKQLGVEAKELSTTLLMTIYKPMPFGHLFCTYWVGDGGVGIYQKDSRVVLLGKVDSGEYAGQTRFLDRRVMNTDDIASRLKFAVVDDFIAAVAMTDGITDPWFSTDNNLESGEYWGKLWAEIEPPMQADDPQNALLDWLDFWSPGNHDDRTLAVLW